MNTTRTIAISLRIIVASAIAATAGAALAQSALADKCMPQMSGLQQRLYAKSSEGPDALRDFIYIRRGVYQLDMTDVQTWARSVDATHTSCQKSAAAASTAKTTALIADVR